VSLQDYWLWVAMHDERFRAQMRQEAVGRHERMMYRMWCQGRMTVEEARCHGRMIEEYYDQGGWWWDWMMRQRPLV
jgi:hypothetical protein